MAMARIEDSRPMPRSAAPADEQIPPEPEIVEVERSEGQDDDRDSPGSGIAREETPAEPNEPG
jgi:hypothetical protein